MSLILISGKILALVQISILSRVLEVKDFGDFSSYLSWINIISIPLIAGLQPYIIRNISKGDDENKKNSMLYFWSEKYVFLMFIVSSFISLLVLHYFHTVSWMVIVFIVSIVLSKGLINRYSSFLYGFGFPLDSSFPLIVIQPLVFSIFLISLNYFYETTMITALGFLLGSQIIVLLIYNRLIKKLPLFCSHTDGENNLDRFFLHSKNMIPLTVLFVITTFQNELGILYLSFNSASEDLAYFKIAFSLAILSTFMVQVVNSFIADKVVVLLKGDNFQLEKLFTTTMLISLLFGLVVYITFLLFGDFMIQLLFGEEYAPSYNYLLILGAGFLTTTSIGSGALILNLSGNEKLTLMAFFISVVVSFFSSMLLYSLYGGIGVSLAIALGLVSSTLTIHIAIKYKLGLSFTFKNLIKQES